MSAVDVHGLPELPEAVWASYVPVEAPLYTADQMRDYARAAVESALRQSGEAVVAFRLFYKTHSGEWSAQGRPWVDGKPDPKLVADATVPASRWKIEYAFAAPPATSGLVEALRGLMEVTEPPEANCSCHIAPPCSDCVDYAAVREAHEVARAAIAAHDAGGAR